VIKKVISKLGSFLIPFCKRGDRGDLWGVRGDFVSPAVVDETRRGLKRIRTVPFLFMPVKAKLYLLSHCDIKHIDKFLTSLYNLSR